MHEPDNELHLVAELGIPGGSLDYCVASVRDGRARDFLGVELQTLDTIGAVWPERQRFLKSVGFQGIPTTDTGNTKPCGINWKMTAKTILVQIHHKIQTFESLNKHLVLVTQDRLLDYMAKEFSFDHVNEAREADPMHFHAYALSPLQTGHKLNLKRRLSTDAEGIAKCLGLRTEKTVELEATLKLIESKLSTNTRFSRPY